MEFLVHSRYVLSWTHFWMDSLVCSSTVNRFFRDLCFSLEMARNKLLADSSLYFSFKRVDWVRAGQHIYVCVEGLCSCLLGSSPCHFFNVVPLWDILDPISDCKKTKISMYNIKLWRVAYDAKDCLGKAIVQLSELVGEVVEKSILERKEEP